MTNEGPSKRTHVTEEGSESLKLTAGGYARIIPEIAADSEAGRDAFEGAGFDIEKPMRILAVVPSKEFTSSPYTVYVARLDAPHLERLVENFKSVKVEFGIEPQEMKMGVMMAPSNFFEPIAPPPETKPERPAVLGHPARFSKLAPHDVIQKLADKHKLDLDGEFRYIARAYDANGKEVAIVEPIPDAVELGSALTGGVLPGDIQAILEGEKSLDPLPQVPIPVEYLQLGTKH